MLKFAFEPKNMVCHIFWPKAKRSKATHGKRPQEQEPRKLISAFGVEDFKWRAPRRSVGRRPFKPQTVLLHRRTPVGSVGGEPYTFERTGAPYIACEPSSFCPLTSAPSNLKLNFTKARKIAPKRNPKPPPP